MPHRCRIPRTPAANPNPDPNPRSCLTAANATPGQSHHQNPDVRPASHPRHTRHQQVLRKSNQTLNQPSLPSPFCPLSPALSAFPAFHLPPSLQMDSTSWIRDHHSPLAPLPSTLHSLRILPCHLHPCLVTYMPNMVLIHHPMDIHPCLASLLKSSFPSWPVLPLPWRSSQCYCTPKWLPLIQVADQYWRLPCRRARRPRRDADRPESAGCIYVTYMPNMVLIHHPMGC